jgi:hypothetical protein
MDLAMSRHCSEKLCMQAGLAWLAEIPKRTIAQREVVSFFGFFQTAQAGNWPEGAPADCLGPQRALRRITVGPDDAAGSFGDSLTELTELTR